MTDLRARVKAAMESKRRELIAKPLAQIWDELADAAIAEAFKWMPIETISAENSVLVYWPNSDLFIQSYYDDGDDAVRSCVGNEFWELYDVYSRIRPRYYMELPPLPIESVK